MPYFLKMHCEGKGIKYLFDPACLHTPPATGRDRPRRRRALLDPDPTGADGTAHLRSRRTWTRCPS